MSSFEMVRGSAPAIAGLPQSELSDKVVSAHQEKVATRAFCVFGRSNSPKIHSAEIFSPNENIYYFRRGPKFGEWHEAFVREAQKHRLPHSNILEQRGKLTRCAYEDFWKVPSSPLFQQLGALQNSFFLSESITMGRKGPHPIENYLGVS